MSWIVISDFNCIASASEKFGGKYININCVSKFSGMINKCNLIDLGFRGNKLTWIDLWHDGRLIQHRLDIMLASMNYRTRFPNGTFTYIVIIHYDHWPFRLNTEVFFKVFQIIPFRLDTNEIPPFTDEK